MTSRGICLLLTSLSMVISRSIHVAANDNVSLFFLWLSNGGSAVKNPPANTGDLGSMPRLGRSPGEGNSNPLKYSCLGNPMDRETWRAAGHGVAKSRT